LSFDLRRTLRKLKPERLAATLESRPDDELPFVRQNLRPGPELLLDTVVYVDALQDRSPPEVDEIMSLRICNHSAVCLAELTSAYGRLDNAHPETPNTLSRISEVIEGIRPHRLAEPGSSAWGMAGILAGLVFRLGCYQKGQERRLLNDALVYLQALEFGQVVLTRNIADFDRLNQLVPEGRVLFYR
jgi:predicted nucleic acid-binding protein